MRNVFKWRIVTNKYLYLLDEVGAMPFIYNKITGERTYLEQTGDTGTTVVTGDTVDEGLIKEQASNIKQEALYCSKFNAMLELAQLDADASKLTFQSCDKYFNLDSEDCVEEAVTPKCEGYEPVFHVSAYTLDDSSDVEYTVFAERNEADKTLRYNLNLGVPRGEKGERGSDGVGCQGAKGDAGLPAIIESVVAHATSAETATASVQMSKTGSTNTYGFTFNFGIPRGEQGPKGEDGYDGAPGPGSRIYPITTSAISLEPGSDPTVNVTGNTRYNQALNTYDTQLSLEFGIPEGYQGETGPDGLPAIIDDVIIDRVVTLDADEDAYVNASVEDLGSGNTYLLHFEFGIPRGESASGGTGYSYYDFDNIVVHTTSGALPYFVLHEDPTVDPISGAPGLRIWYEFYYPERWGQGGGGTDDIKHRYDNTVDSLSEGVQEIIDGDTYPYAVASGIRSHAEGINVRASGIGSHAEGIGRNMYITLTAYLRQSCPYYPDYSDLFFTISEFNEKLETSFSDNEEIYENAEINIIGSSLIMPSVSDAHYKEGKEWLAGKEVIISSADYTDDENSVISFQHVYIQYNQASIALEDVLYQYEPSTCNTEINDCKITVNINVPDAKGKASHIEGCTTIANGDFSHAEGWGTKTGAETDNEAIAAHAEGYLTIADGMASHAGGVGTIANQNAMTAIGKYNVSGGTNDLFVIGNGTDSTHRSNVLSVNGVTNKITLNNSGGIRKESGGSDMIVWNTTGGTTNLTSFSPENGKLTIKSEENIAAEFTANQGTNTSLTIKGSEGVSVGASSGEIVISSVNHHTVTSKNGIIVDGSQQGSQAYALNVECDLSGTNLKMVDINDFATLEYSNPSTFKWVKTASDVGKYAGLFGVTTTDGCYVFKLRINNEITNEIETHLYGVIADPPADTTFLFVTTNLWPIVCKQKLNGTSGSLYAYLQIPDDFVGTIELIPMRHNTRVGGGPYCFSAGTTSPQTIYWSDNGVEQSMAFYTTPLYGDDLGADGSRVRTPTGRYNVDILGDFGGNIVVGSKIEDSVVNDNILHTLNKKINTITQNHYRQIKINNSDFLNATDTTPLNLSGGTNVILTTDNTGLVTINANSSSGSVPVGCIQMYAGATAPDGWLLCQGQSIVKSTMGTSADLKNPIYDNLYDILATGTGAGGLKRIPDFQQRFPLGAKEDDFISREDKGTLRISVSSGAYSFEKPVNSPSPLTYIIDLREICATGYEFVKVASASGTGNIYSAITVVTCTEKGIVTDPTVRNLQACFNSIVITALALGSTYEVDYYSTYPTDLGKTGGEARHTLTEGELARHGHTLVTRHEKGLAGSTSNNFLTSVISSSDTDRSIISPSDSTTNTPYTTYAGNNNPHNNIPPYFAINFIIKY